MSEEDISQKNTNPPDIPDFIKNMLEVQKNHDGGDKSVKKNFDKIQNEFTKIYKRAKNYSGPFKTTLTTSTIDSSIKTAQLYTYELQVLTKQRSNPTQAKSFKSLKSKDDKNIYEFFEYKRNDITIKYPEQFKKDNVTEYITKFDELMSNPIKDEDTFETYYIQLKKMAHIIFEMQKLYSGKTTKQHTNIETLYKLKYDYKIILTKLDDILLKNSQGNEATETNLPPTAEEQASNEDNIRKEEGEIIDGKKKGEEETEAGKKDTEAVKEGTEADKKDTEADNKDTEADKKDTKAGKENDSKTKSGGNVIINNSYSNFLNSLSDDELLITKNIENMFAPFFSKGGEGEDTKEEGKDAKKEGKDIKEEGKDTKDKKKDIKEVKTDIIEEEKDTKDVKPDVISDGNPNESEKDKILNNIKSLKTRTEEQSKIVENNIENYTKDNTKIISNEETKKLTDEYKVINKEFRNTKYKLDIKYKDNKIPDNKESEKKVDKDDAKDNPSSSSVSIATKNDSTSRDEPSKSSNSTGTSDNSSGRYNIEFKKFVDLASLCISLIIMGMFGILLAILAVSLLNIIIYIFVGLYEMLYFMCNEDIAIHDTLSYNILKYVNIQKQDKGADMTAEPYFFATTEQYIVYILLDLFICIVFIYLITLFVYILLRLIAFMHTAVSTKLDINGDMRDFDSIVMVICFVFVIYIVICIVIYKFIFSNKIHADIYNTKKYYNDIDLLIFTFIARNDSNLDETYCNAIFSKNRDMKLINSYFKDSVTKKYEPDKMIVDSIYSNSIIQKAYLYCLYSYLLEIVPSSNKNMTEAINNFFTKKSDDPSRENGFLTFISFLNHSDTYLVKKYYYDLEIFNDPNVIKNTTGSAFIDDAETKINNAIDKLNDRILNRPNADRAIMILGGYFTLLLVINIVFIIILSYFMSGNNNFPEILRNLLIKTLSKLLEIVYYIRELFIKKN